VTQAHMRAEAGAAGTLIRLAEGAGLVRMHPRTLRRWIAQGRLTGWRMPSGHIHVDRDEVLKLAKPMHTASLQHEGLAG
jgi:excisionase family DNA binding protein